MSFDQAGAVADAVLFEGYVLYPYRASAAKNQVRWQFGVLAPPDADPSETSSSRTECLVEPRAGDAVLDVRVRFLQVVTRDGDPPWDEGAVREIDVSVPLEPAATEREFELPGGAEGVRRWWPLSGAVSVSVERVPGPYDLLKLSLSVENRTAFAGGPRPDMLRRSLVAAHSLLGVRDGVFLSLLDPPHWAGGAVASCDNRHTWPVLIDDTTMLSSPIILYDRPEIAAESRAGFCDSTEIDELLVLRTMTLTDEEKAEARATDERAAAIVDYADTIQPEIFERLHGAIRSLRPAAEPQTPWWDPGADRSVSPETDSVEVPGGRVARGAKVRLRPGRRRADIQDMFLAGRTATVAAVLFDVDGETHLAVTIDDDPAAELNDEIGRYLYFAPDEVEAL
jgi:hypothetical protein